MNEKLLQVMSTPMTNQHEPGTEAASAKGEYAGKDSGLNPEGVNGGSMSLAKADEESCFSRLRTWVHLLRTFRLLGAPCIIRDGI